MASSKRIGFFWGDEKITVVEFEKNTSVQVVSAPLVSAANKTSPFSSSVSEEIQITAILQKMLQDNRMVGGSFYISLPVKDIILRSFIIPYVKPADIQNVVKFEARKYVPFDIQDVDFVFHPIPLNEGQNKKLQIIFFAVRKEVLARYDRIFKQVNAKITYCEPNMVSLTKALLFRKEIKLTDNLAFLILDKYLGRICFIDHGVPQFIREFPIGTRVSSEETPDTPEVLNSKIVNEIANSFDFYSRQFNAERIGQMLVASESVQQGLLNNLETELKVKLRQFSPLVMTGVASQSNDMDAIYATGACVDSSLGVLSEFNFIEDKTQRYSSSLGFDWHSYREIILVLFLSIFSLVSLYVFFQVQLKDAQQQYDQLSAQEGGLINTPVETIQAQMQQNTDKFTSYQKIRIKSDVALILLRVASHLPNGALLTDFKIMYVQGDGDVEKLTIDINGQVVNNDLNGQIAVVHQVFSDFKDDKELLKFVTDVQLVSLDLEDRNGQKVTGFKIHCS